MIQEDKQLLLKDLCARLPYGVIVDSPNPVGGAWDEVINIDTCDKTVTLLYDGRVFNVDSVKPYLRPIWSMTEEEKEEYKKTFETYENITGVKLTYTSYSSYDWLNKKMFDYRGLIPMGLALEAPEEMYEI